MELIHHKVQEYAEQFSTPEDELLREINEYTFKHYEDYQMLSGPLQGQVLKMISRMIRPKRILEIGTFTGYSGLCLASGLETDGQLHTIELRPEDSTLARGFFDRSSLGPQIISHTGNALDIVPTLLETWDLVFIDADKPAYIQYFNLVLPRVRKNGFILADNVFFHGQVLDEEAKGKNAKAMKAFNEFVRDRTDVEKLILTVRDGIYLIRKL